MVIRKRLCLCLRAVEKVCFLLCACGLKRMCCVCMRVEKEWCFVVPCEYKKTVVFVCV